MSVNTGTDPEVHDALSSWRSDIPDLKFHSCTIRLLRLAILTGVLAVCLPAAADTHAFRQYRSWIAAMKASDRGPFARIRWFCKDGTVLPPVPYACRDHGGGAQHGQWSEHTKDLRQAGYRIANVYADLDNHALLASPDLDDDLSQMLVERYLIRADDGWILRHARYYRGAFQEEGERAGARRLLSRLAERREWLTGRYLQLRTAAALLPHGHDTITVQSVRQLAASLGERDPAFLSLRNKIHAFPTPADAGAVRRFASGVTDPDLAADMRRLADKIDSLHHSNAPAMLEDVIRRLKTAAPEFVTHARQLRLSLGTTHDPAKRFAASAELLRDLRNVLTLANGPGTRLLILDAGLAVEAENFAAAALLRKDIPSMSRAARFDLLRQAADAVYGAGLISEREREALDASLARVTAANPPLERYRRECAYLALAPDWGLDRLRFLFGNSVGKLSQIEPLAARFDQDQLRGSPMVFYARLADTLVRDGNRLAGVSVRVFGRDVGGAVRALNPGLARGVLRDGRSLKAADFQPDGIYMLPETAASLPPVAGIITAGEGNALSHVQMLARNLGIPNIAVTPSLLDALAPYRGKEVVLAVSAGGAVMLDADNVRLDQLFERRSRAVSPSTLAMPDKLDLQVRRFIDLSELRASDAGRIVGSKAAKLGELKHHFPGAVTDGVAIPFGMFRALLDKPSPVAGMSMWHWMNEQYRRFAAMPPGAPDRAVQMDAFRKTAYDWILHTDPGPEFRSALRQRLQQRFGPDGSYGVFVRSDSNVEDEPGFTGAGLNLTAPNVEGFDNIVRAVQRVWASPFSARAFAWRRSAMGDAIHVYPAVLLLRSVNVEKSGVLVTKDIDSGDPDWLSVAVNEGVGGAVSGQAAESLRINRRTGAVRLMAEASAPFRQQLAPGGGMVTLRASASDRILQPAEIRKLAMFADSLPDRFPPIVDAQGRAVPADVEFGFLNGKLWLFQIRPFLESTSARTDAYLRSLDAGERDATNIFVPLDAVPQ